MSVPSAPSKAELNWAFREGQRLLRQEAGQNKACYYEIEHAWKPTREKMVRRSVEDINRGLRDQRVKPEQALRITSQPMFYTREGEWYRVIQVHLA